MVSNLTTDIELNSLVLSEMFISLPAESLSLLRRV